MDRRTSIFIFPAIVVLFICFGTPAAAMADTYKIDIGILLTGTAPAGTGPWLTAVFQDLADNQVKLTLISNLENAGDIKGAKNDKGVQGWTFNFDGRPSTLSIVDSKSTDGIFASHIGLDSDALKMPSSGGFDVGFDWAAKERFQGSAIESYIITGDGIRALDFMAKNADGYYSGAHIQDLANGKSGTIVATAYSEVPEPSLVILLGVSLGALSLLLRRLSNF